MCDSLLENLHEMGTFCEVDFSFGLLCFFYFFDICEHLLKQWHTGKQSNI